MDVYASVYTHKKSAGPILLLVSRSKGSRIAQFVPKRATQKAPRRCIYKNIIHLVERSSCFVFDKLMNLLDSYCVKTKAPVTLSYVYVLGWDMPRLAIAHL